MTTKQASNTKELSVTLETSPALDNLLLDIAVLIELSNHDMRVAENRYRKLREHLENPNAQLSLRLTKNIIRIYPQGSAATGTTINTGIEEDRFDLDALVEVDVPSETTPSKVLELLYEALVNFPGAQEVVKCTRCIQIRFAFMHMDVTPLDISKGSCIERAGEIFHCPDTGESKRVPANPYGFALWFLDKTNQIDEDFSTKINQRRLTASIKHFHDDTTELKIEQENIPEMLPSKTDSIQIISLKLIKRYLYLRYDARSEKRPPSIYIAKLAAETPLAKNGLCEQIVDMALYIEEKMRFHLSMCITPDERNPSYAPDRLNDRWPNNLQDLKMLESDMQSLRISIEKAKSSSVTQISIIFATLFGEKISKKSIELLINRTAKVSREHNECKVEKNHGTILTDTCILTKGITTAKVPKHNFHSDIL